MQTPATAAPSSPTFSFAAHASLDISLRIGQHVRHLDFHGKRVTGIVRGLHVEADNVLLAQIALDAPIVIAARDADDRDLRIYQQLVPAHELAPFDDREELISALLAALEAEDEWRRRDDAGALDPEWDYELMVGDKRRAAIAKATGSAQ